MSDSYRRDDYPIVAATLVGFLVIFGMIGYYVGVHEGQTSRSEIYANDHHENTKREIERTCASRTDADLADCIQAAIKTSGEYQRAEYDLTAQQEMSDWARWLLIISLAATAITLLGVVYVWKTLVATQEGVTETRRIGEAQVRAYLDFVEIEYMISAHVLLIKCKVRNSGQSPATSVEVGPKLTVGIMISVPSTQTAPTEVTKDEEHRFVWTDTKIGHEPITDIYEGRENWSVIIPLTWRDVFRKTNRVDAIFSPIGGGDDIGDGTKKGKMYVRHTSAEYGLDPKQDD